MVRHRRLSDDSGVTGVEYALIVGLIAVVALVGIVFLGRRRRW
jgi:LPXTG-motif cell wall-anchored protein